jgi:hypothetical protein
MSSEAPGIPQGNSSLVPKAVPAGLIKSEAGESPLDFIQKNLRKPSILPAQMQQPKENVSTPPPLETASPAGVDTPKEVNTPKEVKEPIKEDVSFVPETPKIETKPQATPQEPDFDSDENIPPLEKNYKILRTKYKETTKTLREQAAEATALKTKLQKYDQGEEAPDYVTELKKRITELEPLEQLHKLKTSDAYKTKIIEPLNEKLTSLKALAKDYEIDESVIEEASNITNTRELNQFLLQHFDEVGALEAKQTITAVQKIRSDAIKAEDQPKEALSRMEQEHAAIIQGRESQRRHSIAETGKFSWGKAIQKVIKDGRVAELIPRENDPEFNERYPHAIQEKAAKDYGRIVRELADGGLTHLSPELGEALATASLLSIASAVSVERANAAERYANEVEQNATRRNSYSRPNLGGGGSGIQAPSGPRTPVTTQEAARTLLNKVLQKS